MKRVIFGALLATVITSACSDSGPNKGHAGGQSSTLTNASPTGTNSLTTNSTTTGNNSVNASQGTGNQP